MRKNILHTLLHDQSGEMSDMVAAVVFVPLFFLIFVFSVNIYQYHEMESASYLSVYAAERAVIYNYNNKDSIYYGDTKEEIARDIFVKNMSGQIKKPLTSNAYSLSVKDLSNDGEYFIINTSAKQKVWGVPYLGDVLNVHASVVGRLKRIW